MSLESVETHLPSRTLLGAGAVARLGWLAREEGARRVLCVSDPGIAAAGHLGRSIEILQEAGLEVAAFDGVHENPTTLDVKAGLEVARDHGIDFIVAVGGGSAMDCAKGVNFLYSCGGEVRDYRGKDKAPGPLLGMIAVPTTAGTGSESQSFALISDPVTHEKMACGDRKALPRVALLDPELTLTMPRGVTAATGIDAISHAVESFVTTARSSTSRELSARAWRVLGRSFRRVLVAPGDLEARSGMLLGASLAGAAIEHSMLGAAHSAANPLTARHGVAHGLAVGLLLPHVVRFNAPAAGEGYRELLELAGLPSGPSQDPAEALASWLEATLAAAGLPSKLEDLGLDAAACEEMSLEAARQWTARFNPRPVAAEDLLEIYRRAF
jgi:alcohol dehydrogenase